MKHRMADAVTLPMLDRRAPAEGFIEVGGMNIPRKGSTTIDVDGRTIELTNLDRVMYPEIGFTKAELIAHYLAVAPQMLPFLADRALTLGRFPGGVDGRGFAQSEVPGCPAWLRTESIQLVKGNVKRFCVAEERAALVWLAQMGTIEVHTFLGRLPDLSRPTHVVFDLDPGPACALRTVASVAQRLLEELDRRSLPADVKTSGAAGIHVMVPTTLPTFAHTRALAADVARSIAGDDVTATMQNKAARADKVLIDVRQNSERLTIVAPYSLRATDHPSVSLPISREQLSTVG
jgi:bifunctional non-homologous end joining protein LigD